MEKRVSLDGEVYVYIRVTACILRFSPFIYVKWLCLFTCVCLCTRMHVFVNLIRTNIHLSVYRLILLHIRPYLMSQCLWKIVCTI